MIKVYTGFRGLLTALFFLAGVALVISFFFWGITTVIRLILPVLIVGSYALIAVFILGILPATFAKHLRPSLMVYALLMSQALGTSAWLIFFATVGEMLKGSWVYAAHLVLWIGFSFGMRAYSQWVSNLIPHGRDKSNVIDVDAVEVRGH